MIVSSTVCLLRKFKRTADATKSHSIAGFLIAVAAARTSSFRVGWIGWISPRTVATSCIIASARKVVTFPTAIFLQIAVARKGDLTLSFKGGHNGEGHNHNDVASYILYAGNDPVLVDVGINTYTRFTFDKETRYAMIPWTRSAYHNLPMINGVEQRYGSNFASDAFSVSPDALSCSFAGTYPAEAGVSRATRAIDFTKNGLQLTDRFTFAGDAKKVTEVLMAVLPVRAEDDAVIIGERFRVRATGAKIATEYVPFADAPLERDWECEGVTRILLDFENTEEICIEVEKI